MIYSRIKRDEIISWMREILNNIPIKGEILNIPIDNLNLSVRANHVLTKARITTISDFIHFGPQKLCRVKNAGKKTIYEIGNAILSKAHENREKLFGVSTKPWEVQPLLKPQCALLETDDSKATFEKTIKNSFTEKLLNTPIEEISFSDALNSILIAVTPKCLPIIKARFGYDDGKYRTLEEIGNAKGLTRERIRQIIAKEIRRIKHPKRKETLQAIIENIERLLLQYKGIMSINDLAKDSYFTAGTQKQLRFLTNLIVELYEERYRIIDKYFLTSLSDNEIKEFQSAMREAALKCKFPTDEQDLIENVKLYTGNISSDYLIYHLLHNEHAEISNGKILSPGRLSISQRIKLLMRHIDKPMHFTEIAKLYRNHYGGAKIRTSDLERAIHTRIGDSKDFIIVAPGAFILRDKFKIPDNINKIVETSKEILQEIKTISDTKYLISKLQKRGIDIGSLNEYSLKPILLEYPVFVKYRKFEIGVEELVDKYERKPLSDLIFELLSATIKPMHVKTIWKEILKQRGFPEYAISQRLADDPRFIRVAPATYTVASNIDQYEEKRNIIIDFAKEWIHLKHTGISAFFVNEVLKATEKIKDLSLGLVEHILATSSEFIKLPNGFYDLAKNQ